MDIKQAYLSKPWLKYYPDGVPEAPQIPDLSVPELIDQLGNLYANTRYTAVFLSQDPPLIGPIRSGRIINFQLAPMLDGALVHAGEIVLSLPGRKLDAGREAGVAAEIVRRQESLRTTFPTADGQPTQRIHPPAEPDVDVEDLTAGFSRKRTH